MVSRIIKRRTVANEACDAGRVMVNDKPAKASTNVKEGDIISINIPENTLELKISEEEFASRMAAFVPKTKPLSGYLKRYAALVSSGAKGAILN